MVKNKTEKVPTFTLQTKVVSVVDVEVKAHNLEEAVQLGRELKLTDVFSFEPGVIENASRLSIVAVIAPDDWGVD